MTVSSFTIISGSIWSASSRLLISSSMAFVAGSVAAVTVSDTADTSPSAGPSKRSRKLSGDVVPGKILSALNISSRLRLSAKSCKSCAACLAVIRPAASNSPNCAARTLTAACIMASPAACPPPANTYSCSAAVPALAAVSSMIRDASDIPVVSNAPANSPPSAVRCASCAATCAALMASIAPAAVV